MVLERVTRGVADVVSDTISETADAAGLTGKLTEIGNFLVAGSNMVISPFVALLAGGMSFLNRIAWMVTSLVDGAARVGLAGVNIIYTLVPTVIMAGAIVVLYYGMQMGVGFLINGIASVPLGIYAAKNPEQVKSLAMLVV